MIWPGPHNGVAMDAMVMAWPELGHHLHGVVMAMAMVEIPTNLQVFPWALLPAYLEGY